MVFRSRSCSTASPGLERIQCIYLYFLVSYFSEHGADACLFFLDCRSFSSPLTNEPPLLGQVNSLSSSFNPNPRMHHLSTFSYSTQPTTYSSYLSSPPPPPPSLSHNSSFQPCSFYYGQNQQFHSMSEDRNMVTSLTNYIEGTCLSLRGEEPVWRPY